MVFVRRRRDRPEPRSESRRASRAGHGSSHAPGAALRQAEAAALVDRLVRPITDTAHLDAEHIAHLIAGWVRAGAITRESLPALLEVMRQGSTPEAASLAGAVERHLAGTDAAPPAPQAAARQASAARLVRAMGPLLGLTPSAIDIRTDRDASALTAARGARALQTGAVIHLHSSVDPGTAAGRDTVAHELIHAAQRAAPPGASEPAPSLAAAERQARAMAPALAKGGAPSVALEPLPVTALAADDDQEPAQERASQGVTLPRGTDWDVVGARVVVRTSWLISQVQAEPGASPPTADEIAAPATLALFLQRLKERGVLGWLTADQVSLLSRELFIPGPIERDVIIAYALPMAVYERVGLPPGVPFQWHFAGGGARCILSADRLIPPGASPDSHPRISPQLQEQIFDRLELATGYVLRDEAWAFIRGRGALELGSTTVGRLGPAFTLIYSREDMELLFGADIWESVQEEVASGDVTDTPRPPGGLTLDPALTDEDRELVQRFLAELTRGSEGGAGERTTTITPHLVAVWRRIDAHPQKEQILAELRRGGGADGAPLSALRFLNAINQVELAATYRELGMDPPEADPDSDWRPILEEPVRGTIINRSDLLYAGKEGHFVFETENRADAFRVPRTRVRWVVTPKDRPAEHIEEGRTYHCDLDPPDVFEADFEHTGTYTVHAFVNHNFYLPAHFSIDVEVTTQVERLRQVEDTAFAGFGHDTSSAAHEFETALLDEVGADRFQHGLLTRGTLPDGYERPDFDRRIALLTSQRARLEGFIEEHAGSASPRDQDMVRYARDAIEAIDAVLTDVRGERARGATFFEVRAAYVPDRPGLRSGPLSLIASARRADGEIAITIHDTSQVYEPENFTFSDTGATFAAALEEVFIDLCKAYPSGRMSLRAEVLDATLSPTTDTLGFELDCGSSWESIRTTVWDPAVEIAINIVGVAAMVFFPASATVVFPLLVAYNATDTIARLAEEGERGTLTAGDVVCGVAMIGMDLLPYIGRARPFLQAGNRAFYVIEGVQIMGQSVIMTAQALDQIEHLRNGQIREIAELQEQIRLLEHTNPSDPRLPGMRRDLQRRVDEARATGERVFGELASMQAIILVGGAAFQQIGQHGMRTRVSELGDAGILHDVPGSTPHYDPQTGRIVADASTLSRAELDVLVEARSTDIARRQRAVAEVLGDERVRLEPAAGATETRVRRSGEEVVVEVPADRPLDAVLDDVWAWRAQQEGRPGTVRPHGEAPATDRTGSPVYGAADVAAQPHVAVGNRVATETEARAVVEALMRGDRAALAALGVDALPPRFDPTATEWGIGQLADGQFIVIRGDGGAVDWGHFPGVRPVSHSHPAAPSKVLRGADGEPGALRFEELLTASTAQASANRVNVFPSAADVAFCARFGVNGHVVQTPYLHLGGGRIGNPGDAAGPRVEFVIGRPMRVGTMEGSTIPIYRTEMTARAGGEVLWRGDVWAMDHPAIGSMLDFAAPPYLRAASDTPGSGRTQTRAGREPAGRDSEPIADREPAAARDPDAGAVHGEVEVPLLASDVPPPTRRQLRELRRRHPRGTSESELRALWLIEHQVATRSVVSGERACAALLGVRRGAPMVDLVRVQRSGRLVPIEVKNQTEAHLSGQGNAAFRKFESIAGGSEIARVSHFEVLMHTDSRLPPNFRVTAGGVLEQLVSGTSRWERVLFGAKEVRVRRGDLGEISR
ncbi:MAG: hypothetical protein AMXMBFR64_36170 [Myxococcales bacterium]